MKQLTKEECLEAFNHILHCDRDTCSWISDAYRNDFSTLYELINEHFELKEKATPKKLIEMSKESYDTIGICPYCGVWCYMEYHDEYCGNCGQALDWSEDDESTK